MLSLKSIEKRFSVGSVNETVLFSDFDLHIFRGEFVSVVGSNGSGKTTLLNLISGSLACDGGNILLDGKDITEQSEFRRAARIGRVFQDPAMGTVPNMTIFENLSMAANKGKPFGLTAALNRKKLDDFRQTVSELGLGLEDKMHQQVGSLSGGQRQALSLVMSTLMPLDLLLLDEHTAALDPKTSERIMELTDRIVRKNGITTLMVTHNLHHAVSYGSRLVMLNQGRIRLDVAGEEKKRMRVEDILTVFHETEGSREV